jgi:hypothetical protein
MVSAHGCLAPLLWACCKAEHHGGVEVLDKSYSSYGGWEAERGRA